MLENNESETQGQSLTDLSDEDLTGILQSLGVVSEAAPVSAEELLLTGGQPTLFDGEGAAAEAVAGGSDADAPMLADAAEGETGNIDAEAVEAGGAAVEGEDAVPVAEDEDAVSGDEIQEFLPEPLPEGPVEPQTFFKWPFFAYGGLWVVFSAFLGWQLLFVNRTISALDVPSYAWATWAGVGITALSPVLILAVWLVARSKNTNRVGLLSQSMMFGALSAFFGVVLWLAVVTVADFVRLGKLF
ncbi:MAG: hypothetical protein FWE94_01235 [Coriobacteriia bacterium]|nr:hypothetical protein [Coriobacteriia bacterium]